MLPKIKITNVVDGEVIHHSLLIIQGKILSDTQIVSNEILVLTKARKITWPVLNNRFKAVVELHPGVNTVYFSIEGIQKELSISYCPLDNDKIIKLVYIVCADGDGSYQAPSYEENNLETACNKVSLAAALVQTVMSERLRDHGLPRKCFKLEENDGKVICHTFTSRLKTKEIHKMSSEELWTFFATELMSSSLNQDSNCKFLAFLSGTFYKCSSGKVPTNHAEIISNTRGHVALGGGGLALFGTGCLYSWASSLEELREKLTDERKVDRLIYMDDSCNRGVYWACYSSGLGATLHELAHTFDIGHSKKGIMGLGFHEFRRELIEVNRDNCCLCFHKTTLSPTNTLSWDFKVNSSKTTSKNTKMTPQLFKCLSCGDGSYWLRSQALILFYSKWFQNISPSYDQIVLPIFKGQCISWDTGIKLIEIRSLDGMWLHHFEYIEKQVYKLNIKNLIDAIIPSLNRIVTFVIMDNLGNISKVDVNTMTYSAVLA